MKLFETVLDLAIHKYNFRGKNTLVRLVKKLSPCQLFVKSKYGVFIREEYDDVTWRACCYGYEHSVVPHFVENIPDDGCFIDIGANIGIFSLMAAKNLNANGVVISFEINPVTYFKLVSNIERNNHDCIMLPMNIGLSDETLVANISFDSRHSGTSHIVAKKSKGRSVVTSSWEDVRFLERIIAKRETYIKIDVEGMELKVLKALEVFLKVDIVKKIVLEIDDDNMSRYHSSPQQVYDLLSGCGFSPSIERDSKNWRGHYDEVFIRVR